MPNIPGGFQWTGGSQDPFYQAQYGGGYWGQPGHEDQGWFVPGGDLSQAGPWSGAYEGWSWADFIGIAGAAAQAALQPTEQVPGFGFPDVRNTQAVMRTDVGPCPPGRKYSIRNGQGYCRTNRRMNVLNPKALTRATRRVTGFQTFAAKAEKTLQAIVRKSGFKAPRRTGGVCGTCRKRKCSC